MKRKQYFTCILACILTLSAANPAVYAQEPLSETITASEENQEQAVTIEEEAEAPSITAQQADAFMTCLGETDGYKVYLRPEQYADNIKAAYSDEETANDCIRAMKYAEAVLIDCSTGQVTAQFEEIADTEAETVFRSEAGHFLLFLDAEKKNVTKLRYRVSTLDSEYLFLTQDGKTLELYSTDYEELRSSMRLEEKKNGQCIYRSSDKQYFAVLNAEQNQAWACVKQVAENEMLKLYLDEDTATLALCNQQTGYIWWSSPLNANRDTRATNTIVGDLQSSLVLTYANSSSASTNLRSKISAQLKYKELQDGIEITYKFNKCGISIPVTYRLKDSYMEASVSCADIAEKKTEDGMIASQLTLLGNFGAGAANEDGCFVIPDGSGALIRFNNGKTSSKSYSQKVYGRDITAVPTTKPPVTEKVLLPMYGIVKQEDAMAVIITEGDGNATLNASVSEQSLSSFNICGFNFQLRGSDTYYMNGDYGTVTVFEKGAIKTDTITLRYYPLSGTKASYMGIAETYRNYLLTDGGVSRKTEPNDTKLCLDLYGGTMKSHSVLGVPVTTRTSMTGYREAKEIIEGLNALGVEDMTVTYHNWTDAGIAGKVDYSAKPSRTLGGKSAFQELTSYLEEKEFEFYPAVNNVTFKTGNGYYTFTDTAIRISNAYSRQTTYTRSFGTQNTNEKTKSLLSPASFMRLYEKLGKQYQKNNLKGVCLGELTTTLWGDYGKENMSRDDTIAAIRTSCASLHDSELSILADGCSAYAFPYVDRITSAPLQSSEFDVFDEDIPLYQIVLHGILPYSGTAINRSADSTEAFLTSVATGCNPSFDMIYAEAPDLKDTEFDQYFYSHYAYWQETAASEYQLAVQALSSVSDKIITEYRKEGDCSVTVYEDGTEILVNYKEKTFSVNGEEYSLNKGKGE